MSLIAILDYCSIIVGDILITSTNNDANDTVEIPTLLKKTEDKFQDIQTKVINLKQKIYIINDNLVLAISGSTYEMRIFLEDFKYNFRYRETNDDEIKVFVNNYDQNIISKISCYIIFYDDRYFYCRVGNDWIIEENYALGEISATGTGASWFMEELIKLPTSIGNFEIGHPSLRHQANKSRVLNFLVKTIAEEIMSGATIQNFWGGGFEIIVRKDNRFQKINDLLYIIINVYIDDKGKITITPRIAINYNYYNDILLITSTDFIKINRYAVTSLDLKIEEFDPEIFPKESIFESRKIACCYIIRMPDNTLRLSSYSFEDLVPDSEAEMPIEVSRQGDGKMQVLIHEKFEETILSEIRSLASKMI